MSSQQPDQTSFDKPQGQYRFDPFLKEWVVYSPSRSVRPFQGKTFKKEPKKTWTCPFCPDAPEGAGEWIVKQLPNKYAALDENAVPFVEKTIGPIYRQTPNYGKCEVILYSQDHNQSFGNLSHSNIVALIDLWIERYKALRELPHIQYTLIMENRGKEIGNSMSHPHGQIYSLPFIPPKIEREFNAFKEFNSNNSNNQNEKDEKNFCSCLMCEIIKEELNDKSRIIEENDHFIAEIPYYAHWAFEVHIMAKNHKPSIAELNREEIEDLAKIMKRVVRRYDALKGDGTLMPYVMAMHNAPVNVDDRDLWHFHIEFYTPFRGQGKWKFLAGVELGINTFISDNFPETNAKKMRELKID